MKIFDGQTHLDSVLVVFHVGRDRWFPIHPVDHLKARKNVQELVGHGMSRRRDQGITGGSAPLPP